ncbi:MAG TPA: hypothetical protein VJH33_01310 [Candidatus Paceibacterota bacterium]
MEDKDIQDIYKVVRDNNRMLHAMRRNAFLGTIVKFLLYTGLLVVLPFWLYSTYLAPILGEVLGTLGQVQGVGANAQNQIGELQKLLQQFTLPR